jgi:hypothetical protein
MRALVALAIFSPAFLLAQNQSLATLVLSETPSLDSSPDLAAWRNRHPTERLETAAYDNEYESQGLWCAASVQSTRKAFFYVPVGKPGDPLPAREDTNLVRQCRLLALWYEVDDSPDPKSTSAELAASLGPPAEPVSGKRTDGDWGSGYWNPYLLWPLRNGHLVLAVDPGGPLPDPQARQRLLVIARAAQAPRGLSFDWMGEAPKGQPSLKACAFDDGHNNWQDGLIRAAEKLHAHLTIARAYDSKLLLTYPGIDLNGANMPTDPDTLRRNAIAHFRAFLAENPNAPEAPAAWREAWRLLVGLPPSPTHFACTD